MARIDDLMVEKLKDNPDYTVEPIVPGETAPRVYKNSYETFRNNHPDGASRDWAVIPESRMMLAGSPDPGGFIASAMDHLKDAGNDELDETVRVQHFDIATARVFWVVTETDDPTPATQRVWELLLNGGGE